MDKSRRLSAGMLLLAVLIIGLGVFLFSGSKKELAAINSLKLRINTTSDERARIVSNIEVLTGQRERLMQEVQGYSEKIKAIEYEMPAAIKERDNALASLTAVQNELAEL
ncbi:MAG: hypothetical protein WC300_03635, partial [Candidatus Omnitrophota bacterium]